MRPLTDNEEDFRTSAGGRALVRLLRHSPGIDYRAVRGEHGAAVIGLGIDARVVRNGRFAGDIPRLYLDHAQADRLFGSIEAPSW